MFWSKVKPFQLTKEKRERQCIQQIIGVHIAGTYNIGKIKLSQTIGVNNRKCNDFLLQQCAVYIVLNCIMYEIGLI